MKRAAVLTLALLLAACHPPGRGGGDGPSAAAVALLLLVYVLAELVCAIARDTRQHRALQSWQPTPRTTHRSHTR